MKHFNGLLKTILIVFLAINCSLVASAQIPKPALVGYWQNWSRNLKLTQIHKNYNVIQVAFATTVGSSLSNMTFTLPSNYNVTTFKNAIDSLHASGKVVILSIGGASDPVRLDSNAARDQFVSTINTIMANYAYKFDGIDLDLESTSMAFGTTWTMAAPAAGQTRMIEAVKAIMTNYKTKTGKKMLLTMAPETIYLMGALSGYQLTNANGGTMLPIIAGLSDSLDLIHCQYYNAGGATGGTYAIDKKIYYDNSDPDYITAMTESIIKGFTLLSSKGKFAGIPENKVAIGLPAKNNTCDPGTGTGYNTPADVCTAVQYLQGKISKPTGWDYTLTGSYPNLAGLMTWSINTDMASCGTSYSFANGFTCAFPEVTTGVEDPTVSTATLRVFPNPTTGLLNIQYPALLNKGLTVSVYNIIGVNVLNTALPAGQDTYQLDLSGFNAGVYVVQLTGDGQTSRHRIVVK